MIIVMQLPEVIGTQILGGEGAVEPELRGHWGWSMLIRFRERSGCRCHLWCRSPGKWVENVDRQDVRSTYRVGVGGGGEFVGAGGVKAGELAANDALGASREARVFKAEVTVEALGFQVYFRTGVGGGARENFGTGDDSRIAVERTIGNSCRWQRTEGNEVSTHWITKSHTSFRTAPWWKILGESGSYIVLGPTWSREVLGEQDDGERGHQCPYAIAHGASDV